MSADRIVPVCAICALALAILINGARGKSDQTFDGLFVLESPRYEFYEGLKDCSAHGTAYWLVPNSDFNKELMTVDIEHLERLLHGAWRVRFRGDLSRIGRYGYQERYWREIRVLAVLQLKELNCKDIR